MEPSILTAQNASVDDESKTDQPRPPPIMAATLNEKDEKETDIPGVLSDQKEEEDGGEEGAVDSSSRDGDDDDETAAGNSPDGTAGMAAELGSLPDPERVLTRTPSGPVYSVFSNSTKSWIVTMVMFASFLSPMTANIYFPALNPLASDLGVSVGLINLTLTTYMILQGISPTIFGDFGDMAGRRPAFIVAFTIYIFANLGLALQDNYAALLVLRMLQSGGSSGTLALGYAVVADMSVSAERGKYMGMVSAGINIGPALSPVLGGILAQYLGWRAIFWFCLIYAGTFLVPYVLTVPETSRHVVGNGSIPPQGWNMTLLDYIRFRRNPPPQETGTAPRRHKLRLPNPLTALLVLREKDIAMLIFYISMLYMVFMMIVATLSTEFVLIYPYLDNLQIGLCYLPYGLGCCVASILQGYVLDWNYRRTARKIGFSINYRRGDDLSKFPIERARIQPVIPVAAMGVVATIVYGWLLEAEVSLAGPLVLLFFVGMCVTGSFSTLGTLVIDLYPDAPATATAALNLVRCLFGALGTALIESQIRRMGRGWTYTFWALVCTFFSPIMLILIRWGPGWREERRLRQLKQKEKKQQEKEERAARSR